MTAAERELIALRGHLLVLVEMEDELEAIGASRTRRARHRSAIAEVRARLEALQIGGAGGDLTDATSPADS
jgi:hypothetical protein